MDADDDDDDFFFFATPADLTRPSALNRDGIDEDLCKDPKADPPDPDPGEDFDALKDDDDAFEAEAFERAGAIEARETSVRERCV